MVLYAFCLSSLAYLELQLNLKKIVVKVLDKTFASVLFFYVLKCCDFKIELS